MKKILYFFTFILPFILHSQDQITLNLKSGDFKLEKNLQLKSIESDPYRLLTFNEIPNDLEKNQLNKLGIDFLYYLPKHTYAVFFQKDISESTFNEFDIASINSFEPSYKIDQKLKKDTLIFPAALGRETITIPNLLQIGKTYNFEDTLGNKLIATRTNYTDINCIYQNQKDTINFITSLNPSFHLGAERTDTPSGEAWVVYYYTKDTIANKIQYVGFGDLLLDETKPIDLFCKISIPSVNVFHLSLKK